MAFQTSSYASSSSQSNYAPMELLQLLRALNKQQQNPHIKLPPQWCESQQQQQQMEQEQQHVELSQIELIYRAEGNANLVLALPQFKKVLRLPKIQQKRQQQQQEQHPDTTDSNQKYPQQSKQQHQAQQHEWKQQETADMTLTGQYEQQQKQSQQQQQQHQHNKNAVGILTMDHYVAYIGIIRCLLGNEYVCEADIVAVPNPNDRDWINGHIRPYRPVNRLDKEFGGHYGLLLPDATGLPAQFDILFSNLQPTTTATREATQCCSSHIGSGDCCGDVTGGDGNHAFGEDTYAIEIKPKQGWLLPNDVNNLFDIKPTTAPTFEVTVPPAADSCSRPGKGPLKISTDRGEHFSATHRLTSEQTEAVATTTTSVCSFLPASTTAPALSTSSAPAATVAASTAKGNDKNSNLLHSKVADIRCRYCSVQHLKLRQHKIDELSRYCPLDLFSGTPSRMRNALNALFECPQNNLRIFKNGILIYDANIRRKSKIEDLFTSDKLQLMKHLLLSCLLRDYTQQRAQVMAMDESEIPKLANDANNTVDGEMDTHSVAAFGPQSSANSCQTQKQKVNICTAPAAEAAAVTTTGAVIKTAESEVTKVNTTLANTTTTATITTNTLSSDTMACSAQCPLAFGMANVVHPSTSDDVSVGQMNTPEMQSLPKNCVLQKILHLQLLAKRNLQYMLDHKYQVKKEKSFDSLRILLKKFAENANKLDTSQLEPDQQYLLAATALDCSIMIAFHPLPRAENSSFDEHHPHVICVDDQKFVTKVTLLDLDPKPDSHFAKYCEQTKQIAEILQSC